MAVKFNPFTGNLDLIDTTAAAGSDTQVQFNSNGVLDGSADLTWDDSGKVLDVGGDISSGRLLVDTSSASGAAIFQVQTPTTLSTTLDAGVSFTNTSTKTYPTALPFSVTAGLDELIEIGNSVSVTSGSGTVTGNSLRFTKSAEIGRASCRERV